MRELAAYSRLIALSDRERAKFQAALADKKLNVPDEAPQIDPDVKAKLREIAERTARKNGFIK